MTRNPDSGVTKLEELSKLLKSPEKFKRFLESDSKISKTLKKMEKEFKASRDRELENLRSILTPREFFWYMKRLKKSRPLRVRAVGEYNNDELGRLERRERKEVLEFIEKFSRLEFHITQEFYDHAMSCLLETYRWSYEFPVVGIFKPENGQMRIQGFIDSKRLIKEGFARQSHGTAMMTGKPGAKDFYASFQTLILWNSKFSRFKRDLIKQGQYPIRFHTHPSTAFPSNGDRKVSYAMGIVGFENVNEKLEKLTMDSFLSSMQTRNKNRWKPVRHSLSEMIDEIRDSDLPSYLKKIEIYKTKRDHPRGEVHYVLQPYKIRRDYWKRICDECHPIIRLYFGLSGQDTTQIPLRLNGQLLS